MRQVCGDDLSAARRFCDDVSADVSTLIEQVCAQPCAAPDILIGSLTRIQSSAKRLYARAIFRAAQTVVDAVNDRASLPVVQGRILSLNKLVVQYESGLDDIAPRPANSEDIAPIVSEPPMTFAATPPTSVVVSAPLPPMPDQEARFRAARAALLPLMHFARDGAEQDSLSALAEFTSSELMRDEALAELNLGAFSHDILDVATEALSPPLAAALEPKPNRAQQNSYGHIDFETLMPDFISQALGEARLTDKTVSVSYGADEIRVAQNQAAALQNVLNHIAKTLVRSVLERPDTRRARGQSGAGHIAVTASELGDKLSVIIDCPGAPVAVNAYLSKAVNLKGLVITPGAGATDSLSQIVLTWPKAAQASPAAKPKHAEMAS